MSVTSFRVSTTTSTSRSFASPPSSAIVAVSSAIARDLRERAPELAASSIYTIPNPVDMHALDIVHGHPERLAGQRVHQIQVDVVEARVLREFDRGFRFATVVDAPEALQATVVETLDAEAQPTEP